MKDQFNKVKSIVNEITASSEEQSHGVSQISAGVNDMNRVTQQNAANAEESAAAAQELTGLATDLKVMVNSYHLNRRSGGGNSFARSQPQLPKLSNKTKQLVHITSQDDDWL